MASSLFSTPKPQQTQNQPNLKGMMQIFQAANNPQALIQQMMANNPHSADVMNLIQQHGGDARAAFYAAAKQRGIDPEAFLAQLR